MHRLVAFIVVAAALAALPVTGQGEPTPFVTDPDGDVSYLVAEEQETTPATDHGRADLVSLSIAEARDALTFGISVSDVEEFPAGSGRWEDAASLDVRFKVGNLFYNVRTGMYDDGQLFGEIRGGNADYSEPIISQDLEYWQEGETFFITVPRSMMRDHNGAPVQTGMQLHELVVDSHVHATGLFLQNPDGSLFQPLGIRDRMPDTGFVAFDVLLGGPVSVGELSIATPTPFRASNGGEATLAYPLLITNEAATTQRFQISVTGAPANWEIEHVRTTEIDAGETVQANLVVHTPFGHQHGGTEEFNVTVTRANDPSMRASATMGILYLATPQPAGHHDVVYFHSNTPQTIPAADLVVQTLGAAFPQPWMDTLQDNPEDEGAAILGLTHNNIGPTPGYSWWVCLRPHLQLGLDVNLSKIGSIEVPLSAPRPMSGGASVELFHLGSSPDRLSSCLPDEWSGRNATTVATGAYAGSADINGGHTFVMDLIPDAGADFISYAPGTDLVFRIEFLLDAAEPTVAGPSLEPGGSARLPLDEYFDEHPAGIVHGDGDEEEGHDHAEEAGGETGKKSTPAPSIGLLLAGLLAARRLR